MKYSVANLDGELITFAHYRQGMRPEQLLKTEDSFAAALALAEEHGNCLVVALQPVARVTTERFTRRRIDPLL